jgi:inositol transporter-like SP family MFS transporter
MLSIGCLFMPLVDRANQRLLLGFAAVIQVVGVALLGVFSLTLAVTLGYVVLIGIGQGMGQQAFFQLWSGELFPTLLRSTAQGLMFAVVRIGLGIWSFFVPVLTDSAGFHTVAWILTAFVAVSAVIGWVFAPSHAGKSLEEIEQERERLAGARPA